MKAVLFLIVMLLVGCGEYPEYSISSHRTDVCDPKTVDKRSDFILKCLANANPKADEEPEDWIRLCQRMAEETYCKKRTATVKYRRDCSGCARYEVNRIIKD